MLHTPWSAEQWSGTDRANPTPGASVSAWMACSPHEFREGLKLAESAWSVLLARPVRCIDAPLVVPELEAALVHTNRPPIVGAHETH
jgi:hypothetical protein